ncbi:MAG: TIGR04283 family arsenosugar biosynthesis glycosyltransferase [Pseudomonadales bacterium]
MPCVELSIVIPVLNDAPALARLLESLPLRTDPAIEILVVDGGSTDASVAVARQAGCRVLTSAAGRGCQLNAGCRKAYGRWLWLLHADTDVPAAAVSYLRRLGGPGWGRFDVRFDAAGRGMRLVAAFMNWRSRTTGIATGDQGMFVHRRLLDAVHGVPEQPLMEDVELSRRLKRLGRPLCSDISLGTSPRRWQRDGIVSTILAMWGFRLRYWWGEDPATLARAYYG